MITMLWKKHWMELRSIWALSIAFAAVPAIVVAREAEMSLVPAAHLIRGFMFFFAGLMLALLPSRFAGTGLATAMGIRPPRGTDQSLFFTLSLPVRRRALFFYRTGFCLMAMETSAMLGLVMGAAVFAHSGGSMQVFTDGLPILLLMLPLYFFTSLLSIRFDAVSTMQIYLLCVVGTWFVLLPLAGVNQQTILAALYSIAPLSLALSALLIAAGLAILTVWRLDRQDY